MLKNSHPGSIRKDSGSETGSQHPQTPFRAHLSHSGRTRKVSGRKTGRETSHAQNSHPGSSRKHSRKNFRKATGTRQGCFSVSVWASLVASQASLICTSLLYAIFMVRCPGGVPRKLKSVATKPGVFPEGFRKRFRSVVAPDVHPAILCPICLVCQGPSCEPIKL